MKCGRRLVGKKGESVCEGLKQGALVLKDKKEVFLGSQKTDGGIGLKAVATLTLPNRLVGRQGSR